MVDKYMVIVVDAMWMWHQLACMKAHAAAEINVL